MAYPSMVEATHAAFHTAVRSIIVFALIATAAPSTASAQGAATCGDLRNHYGPYDYTNPIHRAEKLPVVEQYHFDAGVVALKGMLGSEGSERMLGGDIEYVLRTFPNHHHALYTMVRYYLEKVPHGATRMAFDPACWFDRAKRFKPDDATVVMLEGLYYGRVDDLPKARKAYETALEMDPDSAEINYNAGLFYVDTKEYDLAMACALRAYELGHPLPGLRNKLMRLGVWQAQAAE